MIQPRLDDRRIGPSSVPRSQPPVTGNGGRSDTACHALKLSVVITVCNEANTIKAIVARVRATPFIKEIIIVDDGSKDGTRQRLEEIAKTPDVKVIYHSRNQGKCAALRTGFQVATGDIIIVQDAD